MQELLRKCCINPDTINDTDVWTANLIAEIESKVKDLAPAMIKAAITGKRDEARSLSWRLNDAMYLGVLLYMRKYYGDPTLINIDSQLKCAEKVFKCQNISIKSVINM